MALTIKDLLGTGLCTLVITYCLYGAFQIQQSYHQRVLEETQRQNTLPDMAAPQPAATTAAVKNPTALASAKERTNGYDVLPVQLSPHNKTDPFWYDSEDPTWLWSLLAKVTKYEVMQPIQLLATSTLQTIPPKPDGYIRFVCISDTHMHHNNIPGLPPLAELGIDVLLHAGDFTIRGERKDIEGFTQWIRDSPIPYKVVIAGNHDRSFEDSPATIASAIKYGREPLDAKKIKADLIAGSNQPISTEENPFPEVSEAGGTFYLEDQGLSIHGIRIWGSPWQPEHADWGFNLPRGERLREKWDMIPSNTQILMTHGPPIGHGDECLPRRERVGCVDLLMQIQNRIKPRYHVFGHVHEGYGQTTDGVTDFINASIEQSRDGKNLTPPIIFDFPINVAKKAKK